MTREKASLFWGKNLLRDGVIIGKNNLRIGIKGFFKLKSKNLSQ
jgi:hypothetical protein